jgi:hypothetical protein
MAESQCPTCGRWVVNQVFSRHVAACKPRPADRTGTGYAPSSLPCGKEINQGRRDQCCRTECPGKSFSQIDECYNRHKGRR